jgi:hypothetical protein
MDDLPSAIQPIIDKADPAIVDEVFPKVARPFVAAFLSGSLAPCRATYARGTSVPILSHPLLIIGSFFDQWKTCTVQVVPAGVFGQDGANCACFQGTGAGGNWTYGLETGFAFSRFAGDMNPADLGLVVLHDAHRMSSRPGIAGLDGTNANGTWSQ